MWHVSNCDTIFDVIFGDDVEQDSKSWIRNGNYSNHIVTVHESNALPFVFVICHRCFQIAAHSLSKPESWMNTWFQWYTKFVQGKRSVAIVESLRRGERTSLCCNWNPTSSSANTSCLEILVPIFTCNVLGTIGQSNTYFFLLSLTQCLMSSGQNQNSYSTLLVERYYFFNPLYVGAGVPCL